MRLTSAHFSARGTASTRDARLTTVNVNLSLVLPGFYFNALGLSLSALSIHAPVPYLQRQILGARPAIAPSLVPSFRLHCALFLMLIP